VANPELAAAGLLVACTLKSSQFPVSGLFLRSMEGASPNSALGYAALSAHISVVLLAQTMPMWFEFEWARAALAAVGVVTAIQATLIANVRADRKGSIASSTAATVGVIFVVLAAGYDEAALLLALGHSCFRMNQILRSPR
jgi:NADH:ubiquinone oxidoreductase subunit 5 (subunit L)/multisubunit Na+/H+ antiporter MnhA subunit